MPYKAGPIEPVVMPGETVGLWLSKTFNFYKVDYIDGIMRSDPLMFDFGAIAAGASTAGPIVMNLLEMPDYEFGQFRAEVLDDITAMLYEGRADQRHKTNQRVATYTRPGALYEPDGHIGEFFVQEDNWAYFQAFNQTGYNLTQARIAFWGFRYVLTALPGFDWMKGNVPATWTRIPCSSHL
jgi:hypothetical protein